MSKNRKEEEEVKEMVSCDFTQFLLSAEDDTSFFINIFPLGIFPSNNEKEEYITQKRKSYKSLYIHLYSL